MLEADSRPLTLAPYTWSEAVNSVRGELGSIISQDGEYDIHIQLRSGAELLDTKRVYFRVGNLPLFGP